MTEIKNKKIPEEEFSRLRQEVLLQWPTGKEVALAEAVDYHKSLPKSKRFGEKLLEAKRAGKTLIQPRAGVPVIEEHIKLMRYLQVREKRICCPPPSTATPGKTAMRRRKTGSRSRSA